jgi:hypothetical protein
MEQRSLKQHPAPTTTARQRRKQTSIRVLTEHGPNYLALSSSLLRLNYLRPQLEPKLAKGPRHSLSLKEKPCFDQRAPRADEYR